MKFPTGCKYLTVKRIMVLLLVVARSATSFLPATRSSSTRRAVATGMRQLHYNSYWLQQRRTLPLQQAAGSEGETNNSSSSTTAENSDDLWASFENKNNIRDQVVSAMSKDGGIKVTACTIRNSVNDIMMQHTMTDVAMQAIGRTLTCALLMANGMQAEQTLQISLNCKCDANSCIYSISVPLPTSA